MGPGQIRDMDVIPDTRPVFGFVVASKYFDFTGSTRGNIQNEEYQVGFRVVFFTAISLRVGTG